MSTAVACVHAFAKVHACNATLHKASQAWSDEVAVVFLAKLGSNGKNLVTSTQHDKIVRPTRNSRVRVPRQSSLYPAKSVEIKEECGENVPQFLEDAISLRTRRRILLRCIQPAGQISDRQAFRARG